MSFSTRYQYTSLYLTQCFLTPLNVSTKLVNNKQKIMRYIREHAFSMCGIICPSTTNMLTLASQSLYANFHSTRYDNDSLKQDIDDGLTNLDWLEIFSCQTDNCPKLSAGTIPKQRESCVARLSKLLYSYSQLICMTIKSTAEEKMTLCQIYNWIRENFSYYKQGNIQTG